MIRLGKRPPTPESLTSPTVEEAKQRIAEKVKTFVNLKSEDFPSFWRSEDVKRSLYDFHHGKCCFCERRRDEKWESDVEHFRPKGGITEEPEHPGYWWLAYDWDNYFFTCPNCNRLAKKNKFPLLPDGKRAFNENDDLMLEKPVLIHPVDENPEDFIGFEWEEGNRILVKAVGLDKDGRGSKTVHELTGINFLSVMEERGDILKLLEITADQIKSLLEYAEAINDDATKSECAEVVKQETAPCKKFAGFRRAFFKKVGLGKYVYGAD